MSADTSATTFVLIHGAWHGGWCWARVTERLTATGFAATAPTLTGLAERRDELSRGINLSTHIHDIIDTIHQQGWRDVTLVGHSYGGFPATAAAYQLPDVVSHLILLDAFLPTSGEKLLDHAPDLITTYQTQATRDPEWHIPPLPSLLFGVNEADREWVDTRLTPQPVNTYFEPIALPPAPPTLKKTYIRCTRAAGNYLTTSVQRAQTDPSWRFLTLDSDHDAMIDAPDALTVLLTSTLTTRTPL
ncbi:alpha/beta hydrolase [Pectobacterium zantedeschiae]|uniref:Alpha/beta fold hydrolase n=1 Tax=Pectobacterium zantedeschiae TaxID=2034769 RepID=A0A9X8P515_9GAMM|nr:alpha/beta fold hydrolase [Pectobacterium zantedeschiae]RYC43047.1 esterase [Pectobacterium zantedeschiae]RYC43840.1 alpha/beta fold hydrolase [Pectobacterium zantedeschiae]RYC48939.1 esterase [Pectobacterium zantedeschiae]